MEGLQSIGGSSSQEGLYIVHAIEATLCQEEQELETCSQGHIFGAFPNQEGIREGCSYEEHGVEIFEEAPLQVHKNSKRKQYLHEDEIISVRKYEAHAKREYRKRCRERKQVETIITEDREVQGEDIEDRKRHTVENIAQHILTELSYYGKDDKYHIMHEVLNDESILQCTNDLFFQYMGLVSAFRNSLQVLKIPKSNDELFLKRSVLSMLVNGLMNVNQTHEREVSLLQASRLLDVHPRNLYAALGRVESDATSSNMLALDLCKRNSTYAGGLSNEVKEMVVRFWTDHTRVSPNKKDICRLRLGYKNFIEHPIHLLDESQTELFLKFRDTHAHVQIGQRSFEKLKPWFVRKLKDRNTCCCVYHIQMLFLKDAFNIMRSDAFGFHGKSCTCECDSCKSSMVGNKCVAIEHTLSGITQLWESCVCAKEKDSGFHRYKCLMGLCKECGVKKIRFCPREQKETTKTVQVQVFEDIQVQNKHGEGGKRKVLSLKHFALNELTKMVKDRTQNFIKHNFTYRWQADQYRECLKNFPSDTIVSVVDFAENYSFKEQNEIQSMHWHTDQCTILVHITYRRSSTGKDNSIVKEMHFYISDDRQHDTLFVQHCFLLHAKWLEQQGLKFKKQWVWSDGAASQFKAARPFYFVGRFFHLTGVEMTWSFFGSGHGKGEHDGAGAVVKRALTHEQLKSDGVILRQATDVVQFLTRTMCNGATSSYAQSTKENPDIKRIFWLVNIGDVDRSNPWSCETVKGSRSLHSICGFSRQYPTEIRTRKLSCFCSACISGSWRSCCNKSYVQKWANLKLNPIEASEDTSIEECEDDIAMFEGSLDMLSELLNVGDNYAVNAEANNEEGVEFYLLKCLKSKWKTDRNLKDQWNNLCLADTYVITGYYYKQQKENPQYYALLDNKGVSYMYSHLVRAVKFDMQLVDATTKTYYLSPTLHETIYNAMPYEAT